MLVTRPKLPDNIPYLLQRYLDDQLTELEYNELSDWLKKYPDDHRWIDYHGNQEETELADDDLD